MTSDDLAELIRLGTEGGDYEDLDPVALAEAAAAAWTAEPGTVSTRLCLVGLGALQVGIERRYGADAGKLYADLAWKVEPAADLPALVEAAVLLAGDRQT